MAIKIRYLLGVIVVCLIVLFIFYPSINDYYDLSKEKRQDIDYPKFALVMVIAALLVVLTFAIMIIVQV